MLELLLITFLMIAGLVSGVVLASVVGIPSIGLPSAFIGGFFGIAIAYRILAIHKHRMIRTVARVPNSLRQTIDEAVESVDFGIRLSHYLHRSETESNSMPYRSSMPLWTIVKEYWRTPTRSADQIRAVLLRIRERLRQSK